MRRGRSDGRIYIQFGLLLMGLLSELRDCGSSSRKQQISGIKCGFRQVVLLLVFCLISRKVLKVGISMHLAVLCVGNITFCKKNCRALLLGKVSLISGTIINKLKKPSKPHETPVIDGVSGPCHTANLFGSKLDVTLNTHSSASRDSLLSSIQSSLSASHLSSVAFSEDDVFEAICLLKRNKSDACGVFSEHLMYSSAVIAEPLAIFFTAILRHGYMPKCFRDCVILPIPKGNKDTTCSQNYRPIALASSLSKVLERLILMKYESFFYSNSLQFGFKPGFSTTMCTATVKNVVSRYMHNGSYVLGCFLDASKAFDLVGHGV